MGKTPFIPPELPPEINYSNLVQDIAKAQNAIGQLNGLLTSIANPSLLTTPLLTKEAVLSSRIEGTQASLVDVFEYEAEGRKTQQDEKEKDVREIINYRKAMNVAIKELEKRPIGENLIKKIHFHLLDSVRGTNKDRGNLRKMQVYIGIPGSPIEEARYIPPPISELYSLLSNWEKYVNSDNEKDVLVQIAIAHYQFEAIHPFLDGNGRIGRLLISLLLYEKQILSYPMLYISEFFENNRRDYYDLLNAISKNNDWESWIKFFLSAVTIESKKTQKTIFSILDLYQKLKDDSISLNSAYAIHLLDILFSTPIVSFVSIKNRLNVKSNQTIYNLLEKFVKIGILREISARQRNKVYVFDKLLEILK